MIEVFDFHFVFFRFHFLSYNSPISRFCPSGDASYGKWALLTFLSAPCLGVIIASENLQNSKKCSKIGPNFRILISNLFFSLIDQKVPCTRNFLVRTKNRRFYTVCPYKLAGTIPYRYWLPARYGIQTVPAGLFSLIR